MAQATEDLRQRAVHPKVEQQAFEAQKKAAQTRRHPRGEQAQRRQEAIPAKGELSGQGAGEQWWDMMKKGLGGDSASNQWWSGQQDAVGQQGGLEQWLAQNLSSFGGKGAASQFAEGAQPGLGQKGMMEKFVQQAMGGANDPTASSQAFSSFRQRSAGLDPYYQRATDRAMARTNDALAARGMHGSSKGLQALGDTASGLAAEQANREAQFGLEQAQLGGQLAAQSDAAKMSQLGQFGNLASGAQQAGLSRVGLGGNLASMAGQEDLARLQGGLGAAGAGQSAMLNRLGLGSQMAGQADASQMAQMGMGLQGSQMAQAMQQQRINDMLRNMLGPAQAQSAAMQGIGQNAMDADAAWLQQALGGQMGAAQQSLGAEQRNQSDHRGDIGILGQIFGSIFGG